MIIDLILDRKDALENDVKSYNAHDFYMDCMDYNSTFYGIADGILQAMDEGTEENVKNELCLYILRNGYNSDICDFINSVEWLQDEPGAFKRDFIIYDADTLNIIGTMYTTEAEARNYAMMHLININDRLEQMGLQKHKKALVKACYIPNYNNVEFTMICDL